MREIELPSARAAGQQLDSHRGDGSTGTRRQRQNVPTGARMPATNVFEGASVQFDNLAETLAQLNPVSDRKPYAASPASTITTPVSDKSVPGSLSAEDEMSIDPESLLGPAPDRSELTRFQALAKIERAAVTGNVLAHAIALPLISFDPDANGISRQLLDDFATEIDRSSLDRNRTEEAALQQLRTKFDEGVENLENKLTTFRGDFEQFLETQGRKEANKPSLSDLAKRHVSGREMHAVVARSVLQSAAVTLAGAGLQFATVGILQDMFRNNPDLIPEKALEDAASNLGPTASDKEISEFAIELLSKPGSTYVDTATNDTTAIIAVESAVAFGKGTVVPAADSITAAENRQDKMTDAIESAGNEPVEKTKKEIFKEASDKSFKSQLPANLGSGIFAAALATGLTKDTTGPKILGEQAKTISFALASAKLNALVDGYRKSEHPDDSADASEVRKALLRTFASRFGQQVVKETISLGQSLAQNTLQNRSFGADAIRVGMQGIVGGAVKELAGAATQIAVNHSLPADEVLTKSSVAVIDAMADLQRLTNSDSTSLLNQSADGNSPRARLYNELSRVLEEVKDASAVTFDNPEFDTNYRLFKSSVQPYAEAARNGATPPAAPDEDESSSSVEVPIGVPDDESVSNISEVSDHDLEAGFKDQDNSSTKGYA